MNIELLPRAGEMVQAEGTLLFQRTPVQSSPLDMPQLPITSTPRDLRPQVFLIIHVHVYILDLHTHTDFKKVSKLLQMTFIHLKVVCVCVCVAHKKEKLTLRSQESSCESYMHWRSGAMRSTVLSYRKSSCWWRSRVHHSALMRCFV